MSRAYDDSRYLARTLVATLLDLEASEQNAVLAYLRDELTRLGIADGAEMSGERSDGSVVHPSGPTVTSGGEANADHRDISAFIISNETHQSRPPLEFGTSGAHTCDQPRTAQTVKVHDFDRV